MKISDLKIVIENLKGSYKKFADTLEEYPILGVTYPTHYGYIEGYVSEDNHDLDVFVGSGDLFGYMKIKRDDMPKGIETKTFIHISQNEYDQIKSIYGLVLAEIDLLKDETAFLSFLNDFKTVEPSPDSIFPRLGPIIIGTSDIEKSKVFYTAVFGLIVEREDTGYVSARGVDGVHIELEENSTDRFPNWAERNIGTYKNCQFYVPDIKTFLQTVLDNGGQIVSHPTSRPWGDVAAEFADLDGNIFLISQK